MKTERPFSVFSHITKYHHHITNDHHHITNDHHHITNDHLHNRVDHIRQLRRSIHYCMYLILCTTYKFPDMNYEEQSRDWSASDEISSRVPSQ